MNSSWQNPIFLRKELENARRALFAARSVREAKAIQHRVFYLQQLIEKIKKQAIKPFYNF